MKDNVIKFPSEYRPPIEDIQELRQLQLVMLDELSHTNDLLLKLLRLMAKKHAKSNMAERTTSRKHSNS